MHVWSRKLCRWVIWRGTRAAWLALPAAVVTSACVGAIALATRPTETASAPPAAWHSAASVPAPEPGSLAMLATAVAMLALILIIARRHRNVA